MKTTLYFLIVWPHHLVHYFMIFQFDLKFTFLSSPSPKSSPPRPKTNPKPVQKKNPSPIGTGVTQ